MSRTILLNPGPVNVTERVRNALTKGDFCHREPEIATLVKETRETLGSLFDPNENFDLAFFTGSGTAALEAAVCSTVAPEKTLLVIENGVYGARIGDIARAHRIDTQVFRCEWTQRPILAALEEVLANETSIDTVALVHHETTTGLLNPVAEIGAIVKKYDKTFLIDTISGLGGEELDLDAAHVDVAVSTANKCLCAFPGISFVFVRKQLARALRERPSRSLYLDLSRNLEAQRKTCGAFTPAVQVMFALKEAAEELREEGVANRIARFKKVSAFLREELGKLGLGMLLPEKSLSNTITTFNLPKGYDFPTLHDALRERDFVIYAGQGSLKKQIFRVANMGFVSDEEYQQFVTALGEILGASA